jgi:hypothetical protein
MLLFVSSAAAGEPELSTFFVSVQDRRSRSVDLEDQPLCATQV